MSGEERREKRITHKECIQTLRACRVWFALSRTRKTFPKLPVVGRSGVEGGSGSSYNNSCSRCTHQLRRMQEKERHSCRGQGKISSPFPMTLMIWNASKLIVLLAAAISAALFPSSVLLQKNSASTTDSDCISNPSLSSSLAVIKASRECGVQRGQGVESAGCRGESQRLDRQYCAS